ncbi:MAG: AAA-like domain-containing protein [Melioribacteraceae bacterium]|nr:AAA-like domain-containing protein [Melioribacteraceae bacterium]
MIKNPFKFGTVVDEPYFTNRKVEMGKVKSVLNSDNHLIIISPRRFGKTSLVQKVIKSTERPSLYLDLQLVTGTEDFASQLLRKLYRIYPFEKIKQLIKHFRILPSISLNPLSNEVDISFHTITSTAILLEDVLNLIENISKKDNKIIVILDEFQEIKSIEKELDRKLRSIIQHHQNINYVFLGSQEHLMRDIFEKKKSPFYHFGNLLLLGKIHHLEFLAYLSEGFSIISNDSKNISTQILEITNCHPYYTQQLAFTLFELLLKNEKASNIVEKGIEIILQTHDMDFERLWNRLNRTDMKILIGIAFSTDSPLSTNFSKITNIDSTSTIFSGLKRLSEKGLVIKTDTGFEIDDPFFSNWIKKRRLI